MFPYFEDYEENIDFFKFRETLNQLKQVSWQITKEWLDTFVPMGAWTVYGTLHDSEREAKMMAGRLLVFKHGVKVVKWGVKYAVMFWEKV